ncbi:MAG: NADH-quinone oxidoreductase subunit M [Negativicutes bacterium]|nr:NADH-quinone oxidoreductase subunit M [Negativicutes bacterium]
MNFSPIAIALLAPIVGAMLLIFIPKDERRLIRWIAAFSMGIALLLSLAAYFMYDFVKGGFQYTISIPWVKELGITLALGADGLSLPMLLLTNLIGFSAIFASWNIDKRTKEFFILLLLLIAGVMGTFVSLDLFVFFLFYEVVVIPIYIMVIIWGSSKRVTKEYAGMKLTIYLLIGSAFLLVGLVALYLNAYPAGQRTFLMSALAQASFSESFQIYCFALLAFGFGSLLSMFPFHSWSPDGYAGAPTAVSMIHAGVLKKIGGYGLLRIGVLTLPLGAKFWAPVIALLAVGNVAYAGFIALAQKDLKYVVGYSSVSHMGYVLIGLAAMNVIGVNGAVANMFAHGVMSALFFAMIGWVYERTHTRWIPDLGGLGHQMPRVATGMLLAGMAGLGLPGLVSFVPEFTIFIGSFAAYPVLAVLAIAGVVITALYTLRVLANVLFGPRRAEFDDLQDIKGPEMVPLVVLGAVLILAGMFPWYLMDMVNAGVQPIVDTVLAKVSQMTALGGGVK